MEAICSSETSVETQPNTRRHIPEDYTLQYNPHLYILCKYDYLRHAVEDIQLLTLISRRFVNDDSIIRLDHKNRNTPYYTICNLKKQLKCCL
jgi:hypothetical protein